LTCLLKILQVEIATALGLTIPVDTPRPYRRVIE